MTDQLQNQYHAQHPLRFTKTRNAFRKGKMPHDLHALFQTYLIVEGMTEDDYFENLRRGEKFAESDPGKTVKTTKLNDDQRGWARLLYPDHFDNDAAEWYINEDKPSKPVPAPSFRIQRNRSYRAECSCDEPDYEGWNVRWDGRMLYMCQNCAEVVDDTELPED